MNKAVIQIRPYRRYRARFTPRRTDDLVPGVVEKIGTELEVETGWLNEPDDSYAGEWAMLTPREWPCVWIPACDLELLEELP